MRPALLSAAGAVLLFALLFGGASSEGRLLPLGVVVLVAIALGLAWRPPLLGRAGAWFLVLLAAIALWDGITIIWSAAPDRSWGTTNRALVYLALAGLGTVLPLAPRRAAAALAAALSLAVGWALVGKAIPALYPDYGRIARLRSPVGYWNALAQVADALLVLGLWLAGRRNGRGVGALAVYAATIACVLTFSRSGIAIGALAAILYLALAREAFAGLLALAAALPPAAIVLGFLATRPGIVDDGQSHATRVRDGGLFALAVLLGAAAAWLLARQLVGWTPAAPALVVRRAALAAALVVLLAVVALTVRAGGPAPLVRDTWHGFANTASTQVPNSSGRLTSASSSNRFTWWKEAWTIWRAHPIGGAGAGSFQIEHRVHRTSFSQETTEPHSLVLQALAETGLVGLGLLLAAIATAVLAVRGTLRRLAGEERAAALALAVGALAWLVHALVDLHWDYVAVSAPAFLSLGLLLPTGRAEHARRPLLVLAAVLVAATGVYSLASPWLAGRKLDQATAAVDRADLAAAISGARSAHGIDPLSADPLLLEAGAEAALGHEARAEQLYLQAVHREPQDAETWYQLGAYELDAGRPLVAYRALNRSYTLDRYGPAGIKGGPLDRARAIVNRRARARGARP